MRIGAGQTPEILGDVLARLATLRPTLVFGTICFDTRFPEAAAGVARGGAEVLLVAAQNMMRRDNAVHWRDRHHEIRAERARDTVIRWRAT